MEAAHSKRHKHHSYLLWYSCSCCSNMNGIIRSLFRVSLPAIANCRREKQAGKVFAEVILPLSFS